MRGIDAMHTRTDHIRSAADTRIAPCRLALQLSPIKHISDERTGLWSSAAAATSKRWRRAGGDRRLYPLGDNDNRVHRKTIAATTSCDNRKSLGERLFNIVITFCVPRRRLLFILDSDHAECSRCLMACLSGLLGTISGTWQTSIGEASN